MNSIVEIELEKARTDFHEKNRTAAIIVNIIGWLIGPVCLAFGLAVAVTSYLKLKFFGLWFGIVFIGFGAFILSRANKQRRERRNSKLVLDAAERAAGNGGVPAA